MLTAAQIPAHLSSVIEVILIRNYSNSAWISMFKLRKGENMKRLVFLQAASM